MFKTTEGQRVPQVSFRTRRGHEWMTLTSDELFADRTVIVFSLPGAFTPTCSSSHVPRYNQLQPLFKARGIDEIICVSVNDAFVMDSWGQDKNAEALLMVGDGNGEFTAALGLEMDGSGFGLGTRSQRYAMIVEDGVVTKLNVEAPGQFEVSSAEAVLEAL